MNGMKYIIFATALIYLLGCSRDSETLDVDLSTYNSDTFISGEVDEWIYNNLTQPYNIEVVYRFDRGMGDISRNISPPDIDKVIPACEMVLDGFLKVYEKVAGPTFIKTYTPKQFALWGSLTYNTNGTVTLGTADGGRRIVLYDINNLNEADPDNIKRRLRTVHHEFTHIINQLVAIPPTFERVTPADYNSDWTNYSAAEAQQLGFISQYARDNYTEDFAEMVAHLLVEGQPYFDQYADAAGDDGKAKLKQKEAIVVDYFKQYFGLDFRELQYEVYQMLSTEYNDQTQTLQGYLTRGEVADVTVDLEEGAHYANYGRSDIFDIVWQDTKTDLASYQSAGRYPTFFKLVFTSPTVMQLQLTYKNPSSPSSTYYAYYDHNISFSTNGEITFESFDPGTNATNYNNGRTIKNYVLPLLDYFENNTFKADWLSTDVAGYGDYMKYGKFYVADDPTNYVYGPITFK